MRRFHQRAHFDLHDLHRSTRLSGNHGGQAEYTNIPVPAPAIFALPHDERPFIEQSNEPAVKAFAVRADALMEVRLNAFESGMPTASILRLPHANHYVFLSNEADVLREMRAFLASLK